MTQWKWIPFLLPIVIFGLSIVTGTAAPGFNLDDFKKRAGKFDGQISIPQFETSSNEVFATVHKTIQQGNAALDQIGALDPKKVTFRNTLGALDDLGYQIGLADNRLTLMKETSTDAALRDGATDALKELEEWMVGLDYREDVYRSVKAYADTKPKLKGEEE